MNHEQILLERAEAFALHLGERIEQMPERSSDHRALATTRGCELCIEHAYALRILFATGAQNAAAAMLQVQYDALLRAAWYAYVSTDAELDAMLEPGQPFTMPSPGRMVHGLKEQLAGEPALAGLVHPLLAMNDAFTDALSVLEKGGIPLLQHVGGVFPMEVFDTAVRCSNGIMALAFRLLARQGPPSDFIQRIDDSVSVFEDVLPMACFADPAPPG